jgi:V/A-type H+/Na+-transporting ATPase subunit D
MSKVKLTKNELRAQQQRLIELQKYLPTLQLKKAMLQEVVSAARAEAILCEEEYDKQRAASKSYSALMDQKFPFNLSDATDIKELSRGVENIAGIEVPYFESISFNELKYSLFDTPSWVDSLIQLLRAMSEASMRIQVAQEKIRVLEGELRAVSIKVNLFEKILIPRAQTDIRKIKVFLGDQQLAAVSQAKVAKKKIVAQKVLLEQRRSLQLLHSKRESIYAN